MSENSPEEKKELTELLKKGFTTMIRDSEENQAIREKYAKESSEVFPHKREVYYELRLHLTKNQVLKVVEALEPK